MQNITHDSKYKSTFFKQLKVLYEGERYSKFDSNEFFSVLPLISVYALLDFAVPYLIDNLEDGVCNLDQHLRFQSVASLLDALKQVHVFPEMSKFRNVGDEFSSVEHLIVLCSVFKMEVWSFILRIHKA